jgi:transcriptional regulator with GAF, ATPase, and Fis domain
MGSVNRKDMLQESASRQGEFAGRRTVSGRISAAQSVQSHNPVLIGSSELFSGLLETLQSVAHRHCCVMITGETGTGKEMVARKIHCHSDRAEKPFIPVDCTTLTGQLFESQLFGHVKGAFTGAIHDTLGFFRAADGGTIFLDEISEIPPDLQAKLLRVLQEGIVTPIGSTRGYPINVRVLCAANRDLHSMVRKNEFRADLFYRINVVNLEIPPLRQRPDDILPLANHFLNNQAMFYDEPPKKLSARSEQLLLTYHWPGNVREVANAMERAYVLSVNEIVEPSVLPKEIVASAYAAQPGRPLPTLDDAQSKLIVEALHLTEGRKAATAKLLGIDRRRLNRLIEKLNVKVPKSSK